MPYSIEIHRRIYDDKDGSYIALRPDSDGLDLHEIQSVLPNETVESRIVLNEDQLRLLSIQIQQTLNP